MKKLIILTFLLILTSTIAHAGTAVNQTNLLHGSHVLNFVDKKINSTLNIYRISNNNTENILYKPINIDFSNNVHSLKKRKALKKMRFFKKRRIFKLKRIRKKLGFFKERRRKKFIKRKYLFQWLKNLKGVTL
tara:strand:+ start:5667 stop:6065 length:399 start_codon:yes stop_codon:yes gene_type:complete